jgi:hypothetical protein
MPYVSCEHCGLKTYAPAGHSSREVCPRCETPLVPPTPPRRIAGARRTPPRRPLTAR